MFCRSLLTQLSQLAGGLPGFLGVGLAASSSALLAGVSFGSLKRCPVQLSLLFFMMLLHGVTLVISYFGYFVY